MHAGSVPTTTALYPEAAVVSQHVTHIFNSKLQASSQRSHMHDDRFKCIFFEQMTYIVLHTV